MSLKIVFMGTPNFSVPALKSLFNSKYNVLNIYTQPPSKSKRGQKINVSPVEEFCKKHKLDCRSPQDLNINEEYDFFKKLSADIVIVVAYGKIIPKKFLNLARFGFINIHPSILPKWRGAAPIQRAILNEDKEIGVSIMKVEEKLDSGPILISKKFELDKNLSHGELEKKLSLEGADLLIKSLKIIETGNSQFIDQDHSWATYAEKINKNETKINWNINASKVIAHIHGLSPNPGAWFEFENERFKILKAKISSEQGKPGQVLDDNLIVGCGSSSIQILEIQRQGKNLQTSKEFLLGKKINKGKILL